MRKLSKLLTLCLLSALTLAPLAACGDEDNESGNNGTANNGTNNGDPNNGDPNNGDPNNGDPNNGDPNNGDPNNGDPNNGDPNNGDPNNGQECADDAQSPNHDADGATPVALGASLEGTICPEVPDFFLLTLGAGARANVGIAFDAEVGDLDMVAFNKADLETAVAESAGTEDTESFTLEADGPTEFVVVVFGYEGAGGDYTFSADQGCLVDADCPSGQACDRVTITCVDYADPNCGGDGELDPNGSDSRAAAVTFTDNVANYDNLGLCEGDQDFFRVPVAAGQTLTASATSTEGDVFLVALNTDSDVLVTAEPDEEGVSQIVLPFMPAGDVLLLTIPIEPMAAFSYDLAVAINPQGCVNNLDCAITDGERGFCQGDGACAALELDTPSGLGGPCDSADDCSEDAEGCFNASRSADGFLCTNSCRADADCAALGEGAYCEEINQVCLKTCASDDVCPDGQSCNSGRCGQCYDDVTCGEGRACLFGAEAAGGACGVFEAPGCGDDANEPNNTHGTATMADVSGGAANFMGQRLCAGDIDIFVVETTETGSLRATATFADAAEGTDLDIWILPFEGADAPIGSGLSIEAGMEAGVADLIPAGRYTVRVVQYSGDPETAYNLNLSFVAETCAMDADCASTTTRRLSCSEGACVGLEGNGEVAPGGTCDSSDDCNADAALCFTGAADAPANVCTIDCFGDEDCAAIPGTTCQAVGFFGFCLP